MISNQVTAPIKRLLRPCVRFYQCQQTAATVCLASSLLTQPPLVSHHPTTRVLTSSSNVLKLDQPHFCHQSSRLLSHSCTLCDSAREQPVVIEKKFVLENGEKEKAILAASSLEELLDMVGKVTSQYHAALVIQKLSALHKQGLLKGQNPETILQDTDFVHITQVLDRNMTKISPKVLLTTLDAVYSMTPNNIFLVKTMATQLQWLIRRLPVPLLVQVLQLHMSHQETPLRESIVQHTLSALEKRWVELTSVKDIIYLMYSLKNGTTVSQTLTDRLEDRALDMVEQASPKELYRILYILSRQRHRNTPLIRAVLYHLNKTSLTSLTAIQLANLAYACCMLNIYDVSLLEKVTAELKSKHDGLTPKLAASLLGSFSRLRWNHAETNQLLLETIESANEVTISPATDKGESIPEFPPILQKLDVADRVGIVHSLANLNLNTALCQSIARRVAASPDIQALRQSSHWLWLDVVWSLAVLQTLDAASAASVLSEDFWGSLPVSDNFQSVITMTKLSNVNSAARYEVEGYTGPFLPDVLSSGDAKLLVRGEQRATQKVLAALTNMAPLDSYTVTNTTATGGYIIDAEFYVDGSGEPRPLSQVAQKKAQYHRMALKVLDFPDLTLPTFELTGLHAMAARHLQHQGYTVIQVRHTEVASKTKVVELVQFLQQKIKQALKEAASCKPSS